MQLYNQIDIHLSSTFTVQTNFLCLIFSVIIIVILVELRDCWIWINLNTMGLYRLSIIICNISKSSPLIVSVVSELQAEFQTIEKNERNQQDLYGYG